MTGPATPLGGHAPWPGGRYRAGSDTGAEALEALAPRQEAPYTCQRGHSFTVTLAAGVEPPDTWDCRCGAPAGPAPPDPPETTREHHYRLLLMRRTPDELATILADAIREHCTH